MIDPNCAARTRSSICITSSDIRSPLGEVADLGKGRSNPANPQWTDTAFEAFDAEGIRRTKTCGQVAELADLDYTYDDLDHAPEARTPGPADEAGLPERPGGGPRDRGRGRRRARSRPGLGHAWPGRRGQIADAARASDADAPRVYLHLKDRRRNARDRLGGLARPGRYGLDPENAVGTISFFGRGHAHGGEPAETVGGVEGERFIFDITEVVRRLKMRRWDHSKITVWFAPSPWRASRE